MQSDFVLLCNKERVHRMNFIKTRYCHLGLLMGLSEDQLSTGSEDLSVTLSSASSSLCGHG